MDRDDNYDDLEHLKKYGKKVLWFMSRTWGIFYLIIVLSTWGYMEYHETESIPMDQSGHIMQLNTYGFNQQFNIEDNMKVICGSLKMWIFRMFAIHALLIVARDLVEYLHNLIDNTFSETLCISLEFALMTYTRFAVFAFVVIHYNAV